MRCHCDCVDGETSVESAKTSSFLRIRRATDRHMSSLVIIPARLASTRLPRKMLLAETGKPLVQHTVEAASHATKPADVCVATDSSEIFDTVRAFGGNAAMTSEECESGTDRVAEVARTLPEHDIVVNVQGDEPDLSGSAIDQVISILEDDTQAVMATLATPIRTREKLDDPSCVKVVFDECGSAMYFSRSVIPHPRDWSDTMLTWERPMFYQHVGLYAYRRDFLLQLAALPPSLLEQTEKLEQLRVLEAGYRISVGVTDHQAIGIDTREDYAEFVARFQRAAA